MQKQGSGIRFLFMLVVTIFYLKVSALQAQKKHDASLIDTTLLNSANGIVREYTTLFEVEDEGSAVKKVTYVVTILNKQGEHFGIFNEMYHKFLEVKKVSGKIYDAHGTLIRELKKNDFNDVSAISGFSLYEDNRRKYISPVTNFFPYTVEYEYEIEYDGLFYYPTWYPVTDYHLALESASLTVVIPNDLRLRYKTQHMGGKLSNEESDKETKYNWQINNIPAFKKEPFSTKLDLMVPAIYLAPNQFEIDGYEGSLSSWKDFGLWVQKLNEGRDKLSKRSTTDIAELFTATEDTLERIKKIYEYVQSRTRYVNIKLGIGGYQPHEAQLVHDVGYGDCKALTNYTQALLELAGIKSYYTLVKAGSDAPDIMTDFPSAQFNHAFLCVPYNQDTIWLECSSQVTPFNYLGSFTDNRHVLVITEQGGVITKTPEYTLNDNKKVTSGRFNLSGNGNARGNLSIKYQGVFYDEVANMANMAKAEQKTWLYDNLTFPSFEIRQFSVANRKTETPPEIEITLDLSIEKFAGTSNKRLFIPVNVLNTGQDPEYHVEALSDQRSSPVLINRSTTQIDSLFVSFPTDYEIEYIPASVEESNGVGQFKTEYSNKNNTIRFNRYFVQKEGRYEPEKITEWQKILAQERALNKLKIVLVNE